MPKFAICNETFGEWPWEKVCRFVAETGYEGIELAPFTFAPSVEELTAEDRQRIARVARDAGLEVVGLHWLLVSPKGLHINSPDPAVRQRTTEYLRSLIHFCADVGGRVMTFGSPTQRWVAENTPQDQAREWTVAAFRAVMPEAAARGVMLCMEALPPPESNFVQNMAEAAQVMRAVDHPNFRLMLDVKSMCTEGRPLPEIIREFCPHVEHFHANDANRRGPGFGDTDFRPIAAALQECGYSHYVSVEVFDYSPDPETIARGSLHTLREVFGTASR
jgi:D-psicose/D-tagatose/L-ribulose 3-epimerase